MQKTSLNVSTASFLAKNKDKTKHKKTVNKALLPLKRPLLHKSNYLPLKPNTLHTGIKSYYCQKLIKSLKIDKLYHSPKTLFFYCLPITSTPLYIHFYQLFYFLKKTL
jgi:hypothetical protein